MSMRLIKALALLQFIFLFGPLLLVGSQIELEKTYFDESLMTSLQLSFYQAILSSLFSVFLGAFSAIGLASIGFKKNLIQLLLLSPCFIPPIYIVPGLIHFFEPIFSLTNVNGLILVNTIMNVGLAAVILELALQERLGRLYEISRVFGASQFQFLKAGSGLLVFHGLYLLFFVFCLCFLSFSIPLLLRVSTIEVLSYESLALFADTSRASYIAVLGLSIPLLLGFFFRPLAYSMDESAKLYRFGHPGFLIPAVLSLVTVILGFAYSMIPILQFQWDSLQVSYLMELSSSSFLLGLQTGLISIFMILILIITLTYLPSLERFLLGYSLGSSVVFALAVISLQSYLKVSEFHLASFAICLVFYLPLAKVFILPRLKELQVQCQMARVLGASPWQILNLIYLPILGSRVLMMAGVVSVWACAEFGILKLITADLGYLSLAAEAALWSYEFELSSVYVVLNLMVGLALALIFFGGSYVCREKLS